MTIVFLSSLPTVTAVAVVASSVFVVRATSSSGMIATGLKKWNPTTRSGFFNPSLIASTDRDDVFVARTHSGEMMVSSFLNSSCLSESSSKIASITKSHPANTLWSAEPDTRADSRSALSCDMRRFSTSFANSARTHATPLSARA